MDKALSLAIGLVLIWAMRRWHAKRWAELEQIYAEKGIHMEGNGGA